MNNEGCHIVCTLLPNGICVDVTMHMHTYCILGVFVSIMIEDAEVVDLQRTVVVYVAPGCSLLKHGSSMFWP